MPRKDITIEQYHKLKDCKILTLTNELRSGFKLVRKNKNYSLVAFLCNDKVTVLQILYKNSYVINI